MLPPYKGLGTVTPPVRCVPCQNTLQTVLLPAGYTQLPPNNDLRKRQCRLCLVLSSTCLDWQNMYLLNFSCSFGDGDNLLHPV